MHLKDRPLADEVDLDALALSTDGLSGADLAAICSQAARSSIRRAVENAAENTLTKRHKLVMYKFASQHCPVA